MDKYVQGTFITQELVNNKRAKIPSAYRLLDISSEQLRDVVRARARRGFNRGLKRKSMGKLLDIFSEQLRDVVRARARRGFNYGFEHKPVGLIKKLRKAKQEARRTRGWA